MSDILDALRKAELQRSTPGVPGISTRQRYLSRPGRRSWPAPLLIIGALAVGASLAGAGTVYLIQGKNEPHSMALAEAKSASVGEKALAQPQHPPLLEQGTPAPGNPSDLSSPPQPTQTGVTNSTVTESAATVADGADSDGEKDAPPAPKSAPPKNPPTTTPATTETEVALNSGTPRGSPQKSAPQTTPRPAQRSTNNQLSTATNPLDLIRPPVAVDVQEFQPKIPSSTSSRRSVSNSDTGANSSNADVPLLTTLSYQFQTMVPKMSINAQLYSTQPADRFVVINMKRYAEGQQTSEGVTIETIRQEDIIFSYQGQRFRLNR